MVAPNTLRLNSDETIAVAIDGNIGAVVSVFVQDHPGKVKNISQTLVAVQPGIICILLFRRKNIFFAIISGEFSNLLYFTAH